MVPAKTKKTKDSYIAEDLNREKVGFNVGSKRADLTSFVPGGGNFHPGPGYYSTDCGKLNNSLVNSDLVHYSELYQSKTGNPSFVKKVNG